MTRPTPAHSTSTTRRGFTLIELLVTLGLITLLIALLSPMIAKAYRNAERARAKADMESIAAALEGYKQDFGFYPRPDPVDRTITGAQLLCRALIGPGTETQDGYNGAGFRVKRTAGPDGTMGNADDNLNFKVYQPYLPLDKFKVANPSTPGTGMSGDATAMLSMCILDRFSKPILYFPAQGNPDVTAPDGYVSTRTDPPDPQPWRRPRYNQAINAPYALGITEMRLMMGDVRGVAPGSPPDGRLQPEETFRVTAPYLLWSSGPDETFGPTAGLAPNPNVLDKEDVDRCDDITNFR